MNRPTTRRVAQISSRGYVKIAEVPFLEPGAGELVVRVACSLVSPGTELRSLAEPNLEAPEVLRSFGYQCAGVVVDPNGCAGFEVGDRVSCLGGAYAEHSDWAVAPQHLTFKLSDEVSFEEGAFSNLLGTALHAVRRAEIQYGEHAAVVGLGIVGQLICQFINLSGGHAIGIDRVQMRKDLALSLGAEAATEFDTEHAEGWKQRYTRGYGIDAGFIAFGGDASAVMHNIAAVTKTAPDTHTYGRVVIVGGAQVNIPFPTYFGNMDIRASSRTGPGYHDKVWERGGEYPEALVPWNTRRNLEESYHAIAAGKLKVEPLITQRVPLDEAPAACMRIVEHPDEALGVIVQYEND